VFKNSKVKQITHYAGEEFPDYWEKLTAGGGKEVECGWVADKYGLSWQVTPAKFFDEWVKDPAGLQRVTHEVWQMTKLDLAKLEKAFAGK
jgi:predicted 3-demethylubiquinone-9 3-methyltransferase (glyoxalase superfamily)